MNSLKDDQAGEIILISMQGQTIRLGLKDIPVLGRATQGVRIMRMNDNDKVVSMTLVDESQKDDEEDQDDEIAQEIS